uniref:Complex 1 LYR protein domain-containing protein n=1 Tax=Florenciella parvula TaxID=236787 RepID=A0A7S2CG24_9STRA|mmetsp:Transcript_31692/g.73270  ORF Transcript_31692/g.73270 Transcript_31692/m.73270 type:complete len:109 (-) Transcript_31692:65-391(-)|eukprot:CAMPEP_0119541856 /NCGR_PEP_ID=MMETSP1344-20130328/53222_1 /TAXON_ID=236787 /ORGANISM="Florenciella parvula, Strain CCMP2471" /LENGTH=108 /DNA_ID=CAMNT_0007585939 /DNA_START=62 /DNA_END=388 /DNA_ORIENTATION=+
MNPAQFKGAMGDAIAKTTPQLYRDCLRLVSHVGGQSAKGRAMKMMVTTEFRKHADVTDEKELEALRANAVRALSNYMVYESSSKDPRLKAKINRENVGDGQTTKGAGV